MLEQLKKYWAKVSEHPFLKHLFIIVCVLLVLGVTTHLLLLLGTRHSAHRTVPDLTGIPLEEALGEARRQGLEIIVNDSLYVPAYDGGVVLDQLPEKGVGVKPGRTVYVTINSYRQKMVTVPYVAGRSLRQAKNMLEVAGLGIEQIVYRPDLATNYVLEEYADGKRISEKSRVQARSGQRRHPLRRGERFRFDTRAEDRGASPPTGQKPFVGAGAQHRQDLLRRGNQPAEPAGSPGLSADAFGRQPCPAGCEGRSEADPRCCQSHRPERCGR